MDFFLKQENIEQYKLMIKDYDPSFMMQKIDQYLQEGMSILELGMGTGLELKHLSVKYQVCGSDQSPLFVKEFISKNPSIKAIILDAVDFN